MIHIKSTNRPLRERRGGGARKRDGNEEEKRWKRQSLIDCLFFHIRATPIPKIRAESGDPPQAAEQPAGPHLKTPPPHNHHFFPFLLIFIYREVNRWQFFCCFFTACVNCLRLFFFFFCCYHLFHRERGAVGSFYDLLVDVQHNKIKFIGDSYSFYCLFSLAGSL